MSSTATVTLHNSTYYESIAVSAASSDTSAQVSSSTDASCKQSAASVDVLRAPTAAMSIVSVASSSISELATVGSPFHFSVAGYNFQKYTDMVIVAGLIHLIFVTT